MADHSAIELPTRAGVELLNAAGLNSLWSVPAALWSAPSGFDTRSRPDNQPYHTIALRLAGGLVKRIGGTRGRDETLRIDGFSVHPAGNELRFLAESSIRYAHLYVTNDFLRYVADEGGAAANRTAYLVPHDRVMYCDAKLKDQLRAYLARAFDQDDRPTRFEMDAMANLLVLSFLKRHGAPRAPDIAQRSKGRLADWQVRRVCEFMEARVMGDFSLQDLSRLIGLSPEHFCRAFTRSLGQSPFRWLEHRRMDIARALISDGRLSLTEIAQELGFSGQSSFGAAFRRITGMTPTQYRKRFVPRSLATSGQSSSKSVNPERKEAQKNRTLC
jgi:AraC family transcriptional regulator